MRMVAGPWMCWMSLPTASAIASPGWMWTCESEIYDKLRYAEKSYEIQITHKQVVTPVDGGRDLRRHPWRQIDGGRGRRHTLLLLVAASGTFVVVGFRGTSIAGISLCGWHIILLLLIAWQCCLLKAGWWCKRRHGTSYGWRGSAWVQRDVIARSESRGTDRGQSGSLA